MVVKLYSNRHSPFLVDDYFLEGPLKLFGSQNPTFAELEQLESFLLLSNMLFQQMLETLNLQKDYLDYSSVKVLGPLLRLFLSLNKGYFFLRETNHWLLLLLEKLRKGPQFLLDTYKTSKLQYL